MRIALGVVGAAVALTAVVVSAPLSAQGGKAAAQQACAPDIEAYCTDVQPGEGRLAACLRGHSQQLSPACKQGIANAETLMKEVVAACGDDLHRLCAGAAPGTAKECLRQNVRQLSMPCKRELFEAKKGGGY